MRTLFNRHSQQRQKSARRPAIRNGAILPLMAVMLPILLLFAGFAINVAYMQLCQTELQISTDVAAKAAGRVYAIERDPVRALEVANEAGQLNFVAASPLAFSSDDLRIGTSTLLSGGDRYAFVAASVSDDDDDETITTFNAIELLGHRDSDCDMGEVKTYFPSLVGTGSFGISTSSVSTQVEVDIALVIDRSGSMAYASDEPAVFPPIPIAAPADWGWGQPAPPDSRWLDAVSSVDTFLSDLTSSPMDEAVALITYADGARIDQPLTKEYWRIGDMLAGESAGLDGGGTNIASGLQAGEAALATALSRDFAARVVVILTDGKRSVGSNPVYWAKSLAENGVMVIAVTFSDEADQATMKKVAEIGNGFHVHATNRQDLKNAFRAIGNRLPTLLTR